MNRTAGKTKVLRRPRTTETGKPAPIRIGGRSAVAQVVRARSVVPAPANDTDLAPDLELDGALPEILEAETLGAISTAAPAANMNDAEIELDAHAEGDGEALSEEESGDDDEVRASGPSDDAETDEEEAEAEPRRGRDDEPASFLGMYFRDMAELDVLRPEQEFETARQIEE